MDGIGMGMNVVSVCFLFLTPIICGVTWAPTPTLYRLNVSLFVFYFHTFPLR